MEVFNLDIIPGKSAPVIHASQFDAGREFKANLFEGPTVYTLSGAETLSVIVRKPDGNMVTAAVTNTSDSFITFETTEQMTACDGANLCELRIENGGNRIGTLNFIMECEKSPDTGITSQTEINNLETLVDGFTALAVADQYDSVNVIFDNTPTAGHGNGYAVTSEFFAIEDVTSQITWNETVVTTGTGAYKVGNMVFLTYMGEIKTHSANDTLFVVPAGLRPPKNWRFPFTVNASTYGNLGILSSGNCNINQISDNTQSGRIYFSVAYPIA